MYKNFKNQVIESKVVTKVEYKKALEKGSIRIDKPPYIHV